MNSGPFASPAVPPDSPSIIPRPASPPLWKKAAIACLLVVSAIVLTQDLTGRLFGKKHSVKLAPASPTLPDMVKPRNPAGMPQATHLLRQMQVRQDGRQLRGPYRTMTDTRAAGPGSYMLGDRTFWVVPFKSSDEAANPATSSYTVWIPRAVPYWLRWPLYLGLICLLIPKVRRHYATHPLGNNKLPYLEALRGVACFVVVVTHFIWLFYREINLPTVEGKAWYDFISLHRNVPFASLMNAGGFAVDTFFVLSGFVLFLPFAGSKPVDMLRLRDAVLRRPVRLLGVMLVVVFAVWLLRQSGIYYENSHIPPKHWTGFLEDLMRIYTSAKEYSGVFWTISFELWGSFFIYTFAFLVGGSRLRWVAYPVLLWVFRWEAYPNFIFGALLADVSRSFTMPATLQWARRLAPVLFILGLLVGLQIDHDHLKQGFDHWIGQYIPNMQLLFPARKHGLVGAVMVVAALLLSPWLQRRFTHPWLNSLGRQSYSVYGVHEVLIYTFACWVLMALVPFQAPTTWDILPHAGSYHLSVLVTFIAYITVVWMVSLTMTALVDEPCIRLAQRIAKWITGRGGNNNNNSSSSSGRNMPLTTERPAEPSSMTIMSGTVGSPER